MGFLDSAGNEILWHISKWQKWKDAGFVINPTHHLYICGLTGTGKTNTVMRILQLYPNVPYMVIEPTESRDYRHLRRDSSHTRPLHIYSIGEDKGEKIELNPFYIPYGADFTSHIESLKVCLGSMVSSREPLVYTILDKAISEIYYDRGWGRVSHKHRSLETAEDYNCDEHYFYFPRMRDLYDKVVESSESTDFKKGGENEGTIKQLLKSHIGAFLEGPLGESFNTYRNDLHTVFYDDIVFEMPNAASKSSVAILNILLGSIIDIYGRRETRTLQHITVFEEAHLLFSADDENDNDKSCANTAKKFEQLLTTARKFGECIIATNQDPTAIHKAVIGNIRQRMIHKIGTSEICEKFAKDYQIKPKDITRMGKYKAWYCAEDEQYKALRYDVGKVNLNTNTNKNKEPIPNTRKYLLGYAGLENINDQFYCASAYAKMLVDDPQNRVAIVTTFRRAIQKLIAEKCECKEKLLPEYMAYLTCALAGKYGKVISGMYDKLITFYTENTAISSDNEGEFARLIERGCVYNYFLERSTTQPQLAAHREHINNIFNHADQYKY